MRIAKVVDLCIESKRLVPTSLQQLLHVYSTCLCNYHYYVMYTYYRVTTINFVRSQCVVHAHEKLLHSPCPTERRLMATSTTVFQTTLLHDYDFLCYMKHSRPDKLAAQTQVYVASKLL